MNPRRTNGTQRNRVRRRVLLEETECWLCGQPVDTTLPHGLPQSPEVDEVVPVSKGGSPYDRRNCRLAHRMCNQRRGNRDPFPVSAVETVRQWNVETPRQQQLSGVVTD
jgi:5-methylcytosine-specific restriction endonuclease McrA